jgi:hypothetical protein
VVDGVTHEFGDLVDGRLVDQRADLDTVFNARTHGQLAHLCGESCRELLCHRLVHDEPIGCGAGLADVAHLGQHRALHSGVQVGVGEDQERCISAKFMEILSTC